MALSNAERQRRWRQRHPEKSREQANRWNKNNPERFAYNRQKSQATARGIDFLFTFQEWWDMWEPYWEQRGCGSLDMQMCRDGDTGPYSKDNCRIDTHANNCAERWEIERTA